MMKKVEDVEELVYDPNVEETQDVEAEWEDDPSYLDALEPFLPRLMISRTLVSLE